MPSSAQAVGARRAPSPAKRILQPGRNCWRVERADRFYCVQDAADCFKLVRQAILSARHTIFIIGWDIFSAVDLLPEGADDGAPTRLDDLLAFVTQRRPHLRCYILIWDYAALYTLERDPFSRWRLGWKAPRRVTFGFDDRHPVGGSHHQKIVVVDDRLAFCGGIDLTSHRWDTCAHKVEEPARVSAGEPYEPYHEVQAMVSGPVAASLGLLARERWRALARSKSRRCARPPRISGPATSSPTSPTWTSPSRERCLGPKPSPPSASARRSSWTRSRGRSIRSTSKASTSRPVWRRITFQSLRTSKPGRRPDARGRAPTAARFLLAAVGRRPGIAPPSMAAFARRIHRVGGVDHLLLISCLGRLIRLHAAIAQLLHERGPSCVLGWNG